MRIVAITNQKGGVGKTTSAANIGSALARAGKKVLLIDLDPQGSLSNHFAIQAEFTPAEFLNGAASISDFVSQIVKDSLAIVPTNIGLTNVQREMMNQPDGAYRLLEAFEQPANAAYLSQFDYVLIDCPPSLDMLTVAALTAAREVWVVCQLQPEAVKAVVHLLKTIELVKKRLNTSQRVTGVIPTMWERTRVNKQALEILQKRFAAELFSTSIRKNTALQEAASHGESIFAYDPNSNGAQDYQSLTDEILKREGSNG